MEILIPTILVFGRAPYKKLPQKFEGAIADGLLQIISVSNSPRQTEETASAKRIHNLHSRRNISSL